MAETLRFDVDGMTCGGCVARVEKAVAGVAGVNAVRANLATKRLEAEVSGAGTQDAIVAALNAEGVRTHVRKADHYSGNILTPLGQDAAVRVSMCHYNTEAEVAAFLAAVAEITAAH